MCRWLGIRWIAISFPAHWQGFASNNLPVLGN